MQHAPVYERFGLDPQRVLDGMKEMQRQSRPEPQDERRDQRLSGLIKTLLQGHMITERTRGFMRPMWTWRS